MYKKSCLYFNAQLSDYRFPFTKTEISPKIIHSYVSFLLTRPAQRGGTGVSELIAQILIPPQNMSVN